MSRNNNLKIVFGAMTFGKPDTLGARVHDIKVASRMLDSFQSRGHNEVDTARIYGSGSTEEMLATLNWQKRGITMDTKLYPTTGKKQFFSQNYTHRPEDIRRGLLDSLDALQTTKIDMFYLHGPDRNIPFEDTLREINKLHEEGYFTRFGISNYMSWEVATICEICKKNGWIMPTVYQGVYHVLQRSIEGELLPCLRKYGISLYAFQPLAGGFLTGRYKRDQTDFEAGSRFDPHIAQGSIHRKRYWNNVYFDALEAIHACAEKHGLGDGEIALRWLKHHSFLEEKLGDAIIIGASSVNHLETNLMDLEKGPLPDEVVQVVEEVWPRVKGVAPNYWH
ncbi:NADP-dependent oxidoreductase domain-containing protein [Aspergillus ambiguus]|uniref:aldo/keto reductase family protein n=1 Tax=Aspergillus ambiguus TaxID=176160 RepID=UPI003CCE226D